MSLFFGYHVPSFTFPETSRDRIFDAIVDLAKAAEDVGFDMVTVMDHFHQIGMVGPETDPMLEGHTTLAALATQTTRIQLGTLVTGVTYRNPALLAKTVTTLDVISHGRALLGIGAAWNQSEHDAYGFAFPPIGERMDRLDEALAICRAMFREERATFEGRHYRVTDAINSPRPIRPAGPRILVGGAGEKRTLRIVAKYADYSHWFPGPMEDLRRKHDLLDRYCEEIGRDPQAITRTMGSPVMLVESEAQGTALVERLSAAGRPATTPATPQRAAEIVSTYVKAGFGGFTFNNPVMPNREAIGLGGELIRLLS